MFAKLPEWSLFLIFSLSFFVVLYFSRILAHHVGTIDERSLTQLTTLQGAILLLLGLLLGFSFSMAAERWDSRKSALIDEANDIGTTYLRAALLPSTVQGIIREKLEAYIDLELAPAVTSEDAAARATASQHSEALLIVLWRAGLQAVREDARPTTSGLFVEALNKTIDTHGKRVALEDDRLPEIIIWLLWLVALGALAITGYAAGFGASPPIFGQPIVAAMIAFTMILIIDLDRPASGAIRVSDASLRQLRATIEHAHADQL